MIHTICICGAGTMGSGIAQAAAQSGFYSLIYDVNSSMLDRAKSEIEKSLSSLTDKNKITIAEKEAIRGRIKYTSDINDCIADLVIEAIIEKTEAKVALFNQLAEVNHSEIVFATNTSSLSVTAIAEKVIHPERVAGMHFFNPAPVMKLVEVVNTRYTNENTIQTITGLAKQM